MFAAAAYVHRVLARSVTSRGCDHGYTVSPRSPTRAVVYRGTVVHSVVVGALQVLKQHSVGVRQDGTIGASALDLTRASQDVDAHSASPRPIPSLAMTKAWLSMAHVVSLCSVWGHAHLVLKFCSRIISVVKVHHQMATPRWLCLCYVALYCKGQILCTAVSQLTPRCTRTCSLCWTHLERG